MSQPRKYKIEFRGAHEAHGVAYQRGKLAAVKLARETTGLPRLIEREHGRLYAPGDDDPVARISIQHVSSGTADTRRKRSVRGSEEQWARWDSAATNSGESFQQLVERLLDAESERLAQALSICGE